MFKKNLLYFFFKRTIPFIVILSLFTTSILYPSPAKSQVTHAETYDCHVQSLTNVNVDIVKSYDYDPFGNIRTSSGTSNTNYEFQGQQLDPESSMYFLRARYYDPTIGRFISKDPVKGTLMNPQTQNPYVYALNNPINLSDPSGEFAFIPILLAAWAVAEIGLTASDAIDFANTLNDPNANLCDKAWSGAFLAAGVLGPGGGYGQAAKTLKSISGNWYKSTFDTVEDSIGHHLKKHGKGRSIEEYTEAGLNFFNKNKDKTVEVILNDGTKGLQIKGDVGGYYKIVDGLVKLVSFWD